METSRSKIVYENIFNEDTSKQKEVTALNRTLLDIRKKKDSSSKEFAKNGKL